MDYIRAGHDEETLFACLARGCHALTILRRECCSDLQTIEGLPTMPSSKMQFPHSYISPGYHPTTPS
jgi:hypothetical protein